MSYCRFSPGSDVYMFPHVNGKIVCCACSLAEEHLAADASFDTRQQAISHLREHLAFGHKVPSYAIKRLEQEAKDNKEDLT